MPNSNCRFTICTSTAALFLALSASTISADAKTKSEASKIEISQLKLFSLPANPTCGEPVRIVAEIHTTKPADVEFTLQRREGRSQKASLTTQKSGDGYVERWQKEYVYKYSVRREYRVVVKGSKQSTNWIPVSVTCTGSGSNRGIASLMKHH